MRKRFCSHDCQQLAATAKSREEKTEATRLYRFLQRCLPGVLRKLTAVMEEEEVKDGAGTRMASGSAPATRQAVADGHVSRRDPGPAARGPGLVSQ